MGLLLIPRPTWESSGRDGREFAIRLWLWAVAHGEWRTMKAVYLDPEMQADASARIG